MLSGSAAAAAAAAASATADLTRAVANAAIRVTAVMAGAITAAVAAGGSRAPDHPPPQTARQPPPPASREGPMAGRLPSAVKGSDKADSSPCTPCPDALDCKGIGPGWQADRNLQRCRKAFSTHNTAERTCRVPYCPPTIRPTPLSSRAIE